MNLAPTPPRPKLDPSLLWQKPSVSLDGVTSGEISLNVSAPAFDRLRRMLRHAVLSEMLFEDYLDALVAGKPLPLEPLPVNFPDNEDFDETLITEARKQLRRQAGQPLPGRV